MRFFIIDDDISIRFMLRNIIEDEELGEIAGEAADGSEITGELLEIKNIDILLIDLLMPIQDGIETVKKIKPVFKGKMIMISQVESKELIGQAYSFGIDNYITKPINKIEVLSILKNVIDHFRLEKSIHDIQRSLQTAMNFNFHKPSMNQNRERTLTSAGRFLLSELGIGGESGSKDLMEIVEYFYECEQKQILTEGFPSLKETFRNTALKKLGEGADEDELQREIKASEQRVRRAVYHSLKSLASLGLTDYTHPKFENYSSKFFDFSTVRQKMEELKTNKTASAPIRINLKKFIQVLYFEIKRMIED